MKKIFTFIVLFTLVFQPELGALTSTAAQGNQPVELTSQQTTPVGDEGSMPGWPLPDKPIPQHEPGQPSRSGSATYQVSRLNALGKEETFELTGLDAMLADGVMSDPLQGNYRLVSKEDIALGVYDIGDYKIDLKTYQDNTIDLVVLSTNY
jgi:hypothetical protein